MISNRTFGIELELKNLDMDTAMYALEAAGVDARNAGYNHAVTPYWKIVRDGSVAGGCEVISPVLHGQAGLDEVRKVCKALDFCGATADKQCGFHVHFGVRDLNHDKIRNIAKLWIKHEATIDLCMPRSRRGTTNHYCRSNSSIFADVDQAFDQIDATNTWHDLSDRLNLSTGAGSRYWKLNMQAYSRQGTMEFRVHSGTANSEKVVNWVTFLDQLIQWAVASTRVKLPSDTTVSEAPTIRVKKMCNALAQTPEVSRFYIARAEELNSYHRPTVTAMGLEE